jgi:uncharacterized cupin superfamily protein
VIAARRDDLVLGAVDIPRALPHARAMTTKLKRYDSKTVQHPRPAPQPNLPIHISEHAFDEWHEGERFGGRDLPLSDLAGAQQIGVNITVVPPGRQSAPFHWHAREEEHFYVLRGRCILRTGETRHEVREGHYGCFPAGTRVGHAFENPFAEECHVLVIGNRLPDEICVYPDSGKLKVRARAIESLMPLAPSLDYWAGEATGEPLTKKR